VETPAHRRIHRRYVLESSAAMLLHAAVVTVAGRWLRANPQSAWRVAVAVAPVIPFVLAGWAWVRLFRQVDELQRRMHVEALAFAFGGTALCVITYGFLETAGFQPVSAWWVWVVMGLLWFVGSRLARRRWR
jgi:hypothetical protein